MALTREQPGSILATLAHEMITKEERMASSRHASRMSVIHTKHNEAIRLETEESQKLRDAEVQTYAEGITRRMRNAGVIKDNESLMHYTPMDVNYGPVPPSIGMAQAQQQAAMQYQKALQQAMMQANIAQAAQAMNVASNVPPYTGSALGSLTGTSTTGGGTVLGNAATGTGTLTVSGSPHYGHLTIRGNSSNPIRSLGHSLRDTLFMALRGIEEAAMASPKGNHRYDDLAVSLLDMRNFDGKKVSAIALCSFCTSNLIDPEPMMMLLSGHGLVVE